MKTWKKNAVVASVLVFICAGIYLNWLYTNQENTPDLTETLNAEKLLDDATLVMSTGPVQSAAGEDLGDNAQPGGLLCGGAAEPAGVPGQRPGAAAGGGVVQRR